MNSRPRSIFTYPWKFGKIQKKCRHGLCRFRLLAYSNLLGIKRLRCFCYKKSRQRTRYQYQILGGLSCWRRPGHFVWRHSMIPFQGGTSTFYNRLFPLLMEIWCWNSTLSTSEDLTMFLVYVYTWRHDNVPGICIFMKTW
jgi:hypothetical protein